MKNKSVVLNEFKQLMSLKYSKNTIDNYSYYVSQFLDFTDNTPLRVTNDDFLNYNLILVKIEVSDSTRNVAINAVKLYFSLYLKKEIKDNIAIRPSFKKKVIRQINHDVLLEKINKTKNLKARLIFTFGYGSGLRSNEIRELKRSDIYLKEKFITVNGKGSKQRNLPISDNTVDLILEYGYKYRPVKYFFNGQIIKGNPKPQYSSSSILKLVKQNIGNYRFHDLRHSFAMRLYQQGISLERIAKLLGHSKTETAEIYAYSNENMILKTPIPI